MTRPRLGVAGLTMGNRPAGLRALPDSVTTQDERPTPVVVLGNGTTLPELPEGVARVELAGNLSVSGGRNVAPETLREVGTSTSLWTWTTTGSSWTPGCRVGSPTHEAGPRLGVIGFRIADETGCTARRHVPRLRG
jgi:hypothetical protein